MINRVELVTQVYTDVSLNTLRDHVSLGIVPSLVMDASAPFRNCSYHRHSSGNAPSSGEVIPLLRQMSFGVLVVFLKVIALSLGLNDTSGSVLQREIF